MCACGCILKLGFADMANNNITSYIMANNFIQSAVAIADAHLVSDNHCGHEFHQRLARRARIFLATKMAEQGTLKRLFQAIVECYKRFFGAGSEKKKGHQSWRLF